MVASSGRWLGLQLLVHSSDAEPSWGCLKPSSSPILTASLVAPGSLPRDVAASCGQRPPSGGLLAFFFPLVFSKTATWKAKRPAASWTGCHLVGRFGSSLSPPPTQESTGLQLRQKQAPLIQVWAKSLCPRSPAPWETSSESSILQGKILS